MLKKTAMAFGLMIVAGAGMAAQGNRSLSATASTSTNVAGQSVSAGTNTALGAKFRALDNDGNGLLSRAEAARSPQLTRIYDSLDTSETIEGGAGQHGGLTLDQLQAGLQAQASGSGAVGPAVSGGETYTLMKDGTKKLNSTSSSLTGTVGGSTSSMQNKGESMEEGAMQNGDAMRDEVKTQGGDDYGKARTMGRDAYDDASGAMSQSSGAGVNVETKAKVKSNY